MVKLPNFIVIGTPKAGTTALFTYLRRSPDVYIPDRKELHYFTCTDIKEHVEGPGDREVARGLCSSREEYEDYYSGVSGEGAVGEVSPSYLYFSGASERIREELGEVRIVISLRSPIERAYSNYMHLVRDGREDLGFLDALDAEAERKEKGWGDFWRYVEHSLYAVKVEKYMEVFGSGNVHILLFEDLLDDPDGVMGKLFDFLGVASEIKVDASVQVNPSGAPKSKAISKFLYGSNPIKKALRAVLPKGALLSAKSAMAKWNTLQKEPVTPEATEYLRLRLREDVKRLRELTGLDLSRWREFTQ